MNTCEVCNKNESVGVAAMPGVPMSFAYCLECLKADAHPYFAVVANTACIGGLSHAGEWWIELINATLKHLGKTPEQFAQDVEQAIKEMDAQMSEPGP